MLQIYKLQKTIPNLLFPSQCIFCLKIPSLICPTCIQKISFKANDNKSDNPQYNFDSLEYLFQYNSEIKNAIQLLKFNKLFSLKHELAQLLNKYLYEISPHLLNSPWTYAPSKPSSIKERGFSQTFEILNALQKLNPKHQLHEVFTKKEGKKRQAELNKKQRIKNIGGTIAIKQKAIELIQNTRSLVIFDDVITTGSTLNECTKQVKLLNPKIIIHCLVIAIA